MMVCFLTTTGGAQGLCLALGLGFAPGRAQGFFVGSWGSNLDCHLRGKHPSHLCYHSSPGSLVSYLSTCVVDLWEHPYEALREGHVIYQPRHIIIRWHDHSLNFIVPAVRRAVFQSLSNTILT